MKLDYWLWWHYLKTRLLIMMTIFEFRLLMIMTIFETRLLIMMTVFETRLLIMMTVFELDYWLWWYLKLDYWWWWQYVKLDYWLWWQYLELNYWRWQYLKLHYCKKNGSKGVASFHSLNQRPFSKCTYVEQMSTQIKLSFESSSEQRLRD